MDSVRKTRGQLIRGNLRDDRGRLKAPDPSSLRTGGNEKLRGTVRARHLSDKTTCGNSGD